VSLLLDTHVWLWWTLGAADRFPEHIHERIESEPRDVNVSMASIWEIAIKASLGKIDFPSPPAAYALQQMERQRFALLQITTEQIDTLHSLPQHHRDPFDRLLIAAARAERMTVLTADRAFAAYDIDAVIF
jgi:PIN domain nuclease of toxin-antitoxin system